MISIVSVFTSNLTFIYPYNTLFGLKSKKKMPVISLYWSPAQQQTSTCTHQIFLSIYSKLSLEGNEFTPNFWNIQEEVWKLPKENNAQKI